MPIMSYLTFENIALSLGLFCVCCVVILVLQAVRLYQRSFLRRLEKLSCSDLVERWQIGSAERLSSTTLDQQSNLLGAQSTSEKSDYSGDPTVEFEEAVRGLRGEEKYELFVSLRQYVDGSNNERTSRKHLHIARSIINLVRPKRQENQTSPLR